MASTKAFVAQITAIMPTGPTQPAWPSCAAPSSQTKFARPSLGGRCPPIQAVLDSAGPFREKARAMVDIESVLFLGRHVGYPVRWKARSNSRNWPTSTRKGLRRVSFKHGPIALIEPGGGLRHRAERPRSPPPA